MRSVYSILILLSCILFMASPLKAQEKPIKPSDPLWPPSKLEVQQVECASYLRWEKPKIPGGETPPGLLGYFIYTKGLRLGYVSGKDSTWYYDEIEFFKNIYTVTAYYDLAYYGAPGYFMESAPSNADTIAIVCSFAMPFYEPWDNGSFTFQGWRLIPSKGNWVMTIQDGNPVPCARFKGTPAITAYENILQTFLLRPFNSICLSTTLEFDLKLINNIPTSREKLIIESKVDTSISVIHTFSNTIDSGWHHYKFDITDITGDYRIRFKSKGDNSADIVAWDLDNIYIYITCHPPPSVRIKYTETNKAEFSWTPPPCPKKTSGQTGIVVDGYNIYRSDSAGSRPFIKQNTTLFTDTVFYDQIPAGIAKPEYAYFVTALYKDTTFHYLFCESIQSDTVKLKLLSVGDDYPFHITVFPNPSSAVITIQSDTKLWACEISNNSGQEVIHISGINERALQVNVKDLAPGLYLLKIHSEKGIIFRKIQVL